MVEICYYKNIFCIMFHNFIFDIFIAMSNTNEYSCKLPHLLSSNVDTVYKCLRNSAESKLDNARSI